ncbi:BA75_05067T0 [Komagataella pastoris]|uniref:BA75_05067T0 n=1 Tax=Komagataella pastoris TaxID=4922 RepID=A0A1B2JH47_PICPA|nr:BA75_05067T0 [Komagataella pastoris]
MSGADDGKDKTDTTSFEAILAGVKRLREQDQNKDAKKGSEKLKIPLKRLPKRSLPTPKPDQPQNVTTTKNATPVSSTPTSKVIHMDNSPSNLAIRHQKKTGKTTFSSIQVNKSQTGNPLLKHLKTISWEFSSNIKQVDYLVNSQTFVLFLSLKYHKLHPEYIMNKIKSMNGTDTSFTNNNLKLLLVVVDIDSHEDILRELTKTCVNNDLSLVLSWSFEEAANYIVYLKQYELSDLSESTLINNSKQDTSSYSSLIKSVTSVRNITKTDAVNLISEFGSLRDLVNANPESLSAVQGMGDIKVNRWASVVEDQFVLNKEYT